MWRDLSLAVAAVLVLSAGVVHGLWTGRWRSSPEVSAFAARIAQVPRDFGDWHGTDLELSADEIRAARIEGYCYRRYVNPRNRHQVTMLLVCGRVGPIAVHTPDVCFEGAGYKAKTQQMPLTITYGAAEDEARFRTMRFTKAETDSPTQLRVFWGWSVGGAWTAPGNPRLSFAGRRALYKLYVLHETT